MEESLDLFVPLPKVFPSVFTIDLALLIGLLWVSSQAWLGIPSMTSKFNITMGSTEPRTNLESSLMNFSFP